MATLYLDQCLANLGIKKHGHFKCCELGCIYCRAKYAKLQPILSQSNLHTTCVIQFTHHMILFQLQELLYLSDNKT